MPPPVSNQEFIDLVKRSGVTQDQKLDAYMLRLQEEENPPRDPKELADRLVKDGFLTNFQSQQLLQGKWRRFFLGKYKVLEHLGGGGMGNVYLCEHKLMRRRVAVKVLPTARAKDASSRERFEREARVVAALDHPNLVHAYDSDRDGELHFLVMEFVDGSNLAEIVRKTGPLDPIRAAHYIYQACIGLEYAFNVGLVHRDIKPGNLMVDRTGVVKVLDMGLARFFNDEEDALTRKYDENVLGTADYLAPEQAIDSHDVDIRADIYSMGGTFYYLLTGHPPFEEKTVTQKLMAHQTKEPKPLSEYRPDVPAGMEAVIRKMMAKKREDRYSRPIEVAHALERWVQQPIAPPSEEEMPDFCPAASGANFNETTPAEGLPAIIGGLPSLPAASSGPLIAPALDRPGPLATPISPQEQRLSPAALQTQPAPLVESHPSEPDFRWEQLDEDTETSRMGVTVPESPVAATTPIVARVPPSVPRSWYIAAAAFLAALILGLIVLSIYFRSNETVPEKQPLIVSSQEQGERTFLTIHQALKKADPGDVIELWDSVHRENLAITSAGPLQRLLDVTIRAAQGKTVTWTCAAGKENKPLILLSKAQGLRLDGEGLILDGQGRMETLIVASSDCAQTSIEKATLRGFTKEGILITNCSGSPEHPLSFTGLQFQLKPGDQRAAIFFDAKPGFLIRRNDHIIINNCSFGDVPANQAIRRANPESVGDHITLPEGMTWK